RLGLRRAESMTFVSMARTGSNAQLASVKAVTPEYPLRGHMRVAPDLNLADAETAAVPARGTVWLDERLMVELGARARSTIELGNAKFRVAGVVTLEPDRGIAFINIAPRLMLQLDDVPATGLIQTGSRAGYQLLAAGDAEAVARFEQWAKPRLARGE